MSLSITDVWAEGPVKGGAVNSEGTEVTSTAELAKEPGKALPTLHHLPDGEQAQRSSSLLTSFSSALKPFNVSLNSPVPGRLLMAREAIYN